MIQRRMCPHCRAFVSPDDKICPYCGSQLNARAAVRQGPAEVLGGLIPAGHFTTIMILLINFALYAAMILLAMKGSGEGASFDVPGRVLLDFGGKYPAAIFLGHQWWRLVTAGFLHAGIFHILMNSWVLFDLGATVEEAFGTARMLVIYFVGTVAGFLASSYWTASLSVGSSAGIMGLAGAMIAYGTRSGTAHGRALRAVYTRWVMYMLLIGVVLVFLFPIDNAAHIGGLAGGFLVGYAAAESNARQRWADSLWKGLAAVCLALTALSFLLMFLGLSGGNEG